MPGFCNGSGKWSGYACMTPIGYRQNRGSSATRQYRSRTADVICHHAAVECTLPQSGAPDINGVGGGGGGFYKPPRRRGSAGNLYTREPVGKEPPLQKTKARNIGKTERKTFQGTTYEVRPAPPLTLCFTMCLPSALK